MPSRTCPEKSSIVTNRRNKEATEEESDESKSSGVRIRSKTKKAGKTEKRS